eukprot:TRINITY_DN1941_c3_g1_i1.p1 TRINITY_DN1941_c3_g1~~TRINITY_DN1941_c3_g1_i1.p1  ORF type:complete len:447 (+),score=117.16 TRINITY_DN1941_c3_g1_i1:76-1341(+)
MAALARAAARRSPCLGQRRRNVSGMWNVSDFDYSGHIPASDEDGDHMMTLVQPGKTKLRATVPGESMSNRAHKGHAVSWEPGIHNHNQAHLQDQIRKNDPSFSHVQILDCASEAGVEGLWHYPFFFSQNEARGLQGELQPLFRDPAVSVRVKNTATIMRNTFRTSRLNRKAGKVDSHAWEDRNAPGIAQVGRRNLVHIADATCSMQRPNFLHLSHTPAVAAAMDKVWGYFGAGAAAAGPDAAARGGEFHPRLDRPPNLVRCSEWLETTSGMNAHVKKRAFGAYIGIINLHAPGVLQLCHPAGSVDWRVDEETPDGQTPATKVVLAPGSLTILKYAARWSIPYGYSYEDAHTFRLQTCPKDYRASLMFCHYDAAAPAAAGPGGPVPAAQFAAPDAPLPAGRDPAYAGRSERVQPPPRTHRGG